ncbi:hypothetical protein KEM54_002794 [Ascosphaera aggregata]|nr:hypothetical protein KEM54_002794 [Ascosphaera aggregata]
MRLTPVIAAAALPLLASAQQAPNAQIPLQDTISGWFNKAKAMLPPTVIDAVKNVKNAASSPVSNLVSEAATTPIVSAKPAPPVKPKHVTEITKDNWQEVFKPLEAKTSDPEKLEWLMLITGGNKSCFGRCAQLDKAWEEAIPLFSADPTSPSLARLDCENEGLLCAAWMASPPYIYHIQIPILDSAHPDVRPETELVAVRMNTTTVNPDAVYEVHSKKTYEAIEPNTSFLHPFDSMLARNNLLIPFGYFVYGFSRLPSWLLMVTISMFSRTLMNRRMPQTRPAGSAPAPAAARK